MPARINETEWLDELARMSKKNDKGLTVAEWAERIGKTAETTRKMLHKAKAKGWLRTGKRTRTSLIDRVYDAAVFWIEKPK